jgi:hypothetical protein
MAENAEERAEREQQEEGPKEPSAALDTEDKNAVEARNRSPVVIKEEIIDLTEEGVVDEGPGRRQLMAWKTLGNSCLRMKIRWSVSGKEKACSLKLCRSRNARSHPVFRLPAASREMTKIPVPGALFYDGLQSGFHSVVPTKKATTMNRPCAEVTGKERKRPN